MLIKKESLIWVLLITSLSLSLFSIYSIVSPNENSKEKTGYVDIATVFQGFEMKKEMQAKFEEDLRLKQVVLDSLMFQLQTLSNELKSKGTPKEKEVLKFEELRAQYLSQKETFSVYSQEQTEKYDDQILSQLTQYIKDYGVENNYELLFGATGDGSILYATDNKDITIEVTKYINASYQGRNL